jgi:hypothetical protein
MEFFEYCLFCFDDSQASAHMCTATPARLITFFCEPLGKTWAATVEGELILLTTVTMELTTTLLNEQTLATSTNKVASTNYN